MIFFLRNYSSHEAHFPRRQNMEPVDFLEKKTNFFLHGFSRYSTSNMALQKIILTSFFVFEDIAMQNLPWFFFGCNTHKGLNDFFSQKLFKPRSPSFYTSKYGTWGFFRKKIKFFSPRVIQIFDSKHGSPENYSDFFLKILLCNIFLGSSSVATRIRV